MDEKRFDDIARMVGVIRSRRAALRAAIGSVLGLAVSAAVLDDESEAASRRGKRKGKVAAQESSDSKAGGGSKSAKKRDTKGKKGKKGKRGVSPSVVPPDGCGSKICHCPPGNELNCQQTGDGTGHSGAGHDADCCCNDPGCNCDDRGSSCCKPKGTVCFNETQCCGYDPDVTDQTVACVDQVDGIGYCCAAGQVWNFDTGACCTRDDKATTCKGKCGTFKDNCGKEVACGDCPTGIDCVDHICVCPPKTCADDYPGQCGEFSDGCGGKITCTCATGCCGDGLCKTGDSPDACGVDGEACQACLEPDTCNKGVCSCIPYPDPCEKRECGKVPNGCGGSVTCGPNDGSCPVGETCDFDSGMCYCGPDCKGCCADDTCQAGDTLKFCGSAGETCVTCTGFDACIDGDCVCVPEDKPCGDRECGEVKDRCGGIHVCGPYDGKCLVGDTCDTYSGMCWCGPDCPGCCANDTCQSGSTNEFCGIDGITCDACTGFEQCISGACTCVPEENPCGLRECGTVTDRCGGKHTCGTCESGLTCNEAEGICFCGPDCDGCCDAGQCLPGTTDIACGTGGDRCKTCADGQDCNAGICTCDGVSCDGCCSGLTCEPGTTIEFCGTGGETCAVCDGDTESCVNGDCVCDPTKCDGVCCDNVCIPGGVCCVDLDCDPNETCIDHQCTCPSGKTCGGDALVCCPDSTNVCTPSGECCAPTKTTCGLNECGTYDDGCGNPIDCGTCDNDFTCSNAAEGGVCECVSGLICTSGLCHEPCDANLFFNAGLCACVECLEDEQCGPNEICDNSICVCDTGFKLCGEICIPVTDCCVNGDCTTPGICEVNPGTCDTATGQCSYEDAADGTACGTGDICCGGACFEDGVCCIDLDCAANEVCTNHICVCAEGFKDCQGTCIPVDHCCVNGDCSTPGICEVNPGTCITATGQCTYLDAANLTACGTGDICCGGACIDNGVCCQTADCPTPAVCTSVVCTGNQCVTSNVEDETTCGDDGICCTGACVQHLTDPNNCGACGTVCGENSECINGICTPLCVGTGGSCTVTSDCCVGTCLNNICSTQTCAAEGESCVQIPCCDTAGDTCVGSGNARFCQPTPPAPPECVHVGQRPGEGQVCCPRLHLEQGRCVINRWDHCDPKHKAKQAFCERGTRCIGGRVSPHEETVCVPVKKRRGRGSERTALI